MSRNLKINKKNKNEENEKMKDEEK